MKQKLSKYLYSNLSLRILSLVLAVILWVLVINSNDPTTSRRFSNMRVKIVNAEVLSNLNQTYQISKGDQISFSIKGKKSIVDQMKRTDFEVTADLSELSSVNAVPIKIQPKKYANDLEVIYEDEKMLTLEIEDLQQAQIPVSIEIRGEPAAGYSVGSKTSNPNLVNIKGPVSIVKQIKQAKVYVNVQNASDDISINIAPVCYDGDDQKIETNRVIMDVRKIKVNIHISKSKKVPLSVKTTGSPAAGYTLGSIAYEPKYIYLTGKAEVLNKISKINLPDIDVEGKTHTVETTFSLNDIVLPEGVMLAQNESDVMIKVNIDRATTKKLSLPTNRIQIVNNQYDFEVEHQQEKVVLELSGLKSGLDLASIERLNPRIDIGGLEPGKHTVELLLEDIPDVRVTGDIRVQIVVKGKGDNEDLTEESTETE